MKLIWSIFNGFMLVCFVLSERCPRKCACHSSWLRGVTSVVVDCSKQGFTTIPTKKVSRYITSFALNGNYITELPKNSFKKYRYLRELYLYKNFLTNIHKDAFAGLRRLTELSLHSNRLTGIENGTFSGLRSLKRLYLFTNFIKVVNPSTFDGLRKVETVFLHENLLRYIPENTFKPLEQLRVLTLYRNYLQTLYTGSLKGLHLLNQLYLHQNQLSSIADSAFKDCSRVIKLQLGNNQLSNITKNVFTGLHRLNELYLDNNRFQFINKSLFDELIHLRKLVLLGNKIVNICKGTFSNLQDLFVLSLSGNQLKLLSPGMFTGLISLQQLYLQENTISWIEPFTFEGLRSLHQLYLFRNLLYYIETNAFHGLFALAELNLGVNNITGLANYAFNGLPRLLVLQLNTNRLTSIPTNAFSKLRNLFRLIIYFNQIAFVAPGAFDDLKKLKSIVWYPPLALIRNSKKLQSIKSNNLHCDCNIKSLKNWLIVNNNKSPIFCEQPPNFKGWNLTQIDNKFLRCENIHVSIQPSALLAIIGQRTAHFQCNVNIIGNFTWMKDGSMLIPSKKHFQTTSGLLIVHNMTNKDEGQYTCIVTSTKGFFAASSTLKLGVRPFISEPEESVFVISPDQVVELRCHSTGLPPPKHIWYHNGESIINGKNNRHIGYDGRLIISKFHASFIGVYKCIAENELGKSEKIISVRYDKKFYSPCNPVCNQGNVCIKKYVCGCEGDCSAKVVNSTMMEGSGGEVDLSRQGFFESIDDEVGDDDEDI